MGHVVQNQTCKVTICNLNPKELGYKPNEPNTINLKRVGERIGPLVDRLMVNPGFKYVRVRKDT